MLILQDLLNKVQVRPAFAALVLKHGQNGFPHFVQELYTERPSWAPPNTIWNELDSQLRDSSYQGANRTHAFVTEGKWIPAARFLFTFIPTRYPKLL